MNPVMWAAALSTAVFFGTLGCLELGYRWGHRSIAKAPDLAHEGIGAIEAAVFALLGLLLGFSFAGATSRLDTRRHLIVEEANAIGTAYLRLDLLPSSNQPEIRQLFRRYLDARLSAYDKLPDPYSAAQELARAAQVQQDIWSRTVTATREDPSKESARLLLPAINEMISPYDCAAGSFAGPHRRLAHWCGAAEWVAGRLRDGETNEPKLASHVSLRCGPGDDNLCSARSRSSPIRSDSAGCSRSSPCSTAGFDSVN